MSLNAMKQLRNICHNDGLLSVKFKLKAGEAEFLFISNRCIADVCEKYPNR